MKRIIAIFVIAGCIFTACGNTNDAVDSTDKQDMISEVKEENNDKEIEFESDPKDKLESENEEEEPEQEKTFSLSEIWDGKEKYITFGSYEQDNNEENGKEPIEWEILGEDENGILIISRYTLDCVPYDENDMEVTWETCTLREWLNKKFYKKSFNDLEKMLINSVVLKKDDNEYWGTDAGNDTEDKIFCLSFREVEKYYDFTLFYDEAHKDAEGKYNMGYSQDLIIPATEYAKAKGAPMTSKWEISDDYYKELCEEYGYTEDGYKPRSSDWWLRTPGRLNDWACVVTTKGGIGEVHYLPVGGESIGIRPALYLKK